MSGHELLRAGGRLSRMSVSVGVGWGILTALSGALSAYYNEWRVYHSLQELSPGSDYRSPSWLLGVEQVGILLVPLTILWVALACSSSSGLPRGRARYGYAAGVVALCGLTFADFWARSLMEPGGLADHLFTPRFVDDLLLIVLGLVAIGLTAWMARPRQH